MISNCTKVLDLSVSFVSLQRFNTSSGWHGFFGKFFFNETTKIRRLDVADHIIPKVLRKTFENLWDLMISARHLRVNDGGCPLKSWYLCLARADLVCSTEKLKCSLHNGKPFSEGPLRILWHIQRITFIWRLPLLPSLVFLTTDVRRRKKNYELFWCRI